MQNLFNMQKLLTVETVTKAHIYIRPITQVYTDVNIKQM